MKNLAKYKMPQQKYRNNQEQVWLAIEFKDRLEKLQAKKRLNGKKVSLSELTKEMLMTKSWENMEKELLEMDKNISKNILNLKVKFDGSMLQ
jgi:hypothetical protein